MKNVKKSLALFLMVLMLSTQVSAVDLNGDASTGPMGSGAEGNAWNGPVGIRVSIVSSTDGSDVKAIMDLSNYDTTALAFKKNGNPVNVPVAVCGMGYNKFQYRDMPASGFNPQEAEGFYSSEIPATTTPMPDIIVNSVANFPAVKEWLSDAVSLELLCTQLGVDKTTLMDGTNYMVIEPIAYFTYNGDVYGMTSTECAMFNRSLVDAGVEVTLRDKMANLTHRGLPNSAYLEKEELGINKPENIKTGSGQYYNDAQIINTFGIAILTAADFGGSGITGDGGPPECPDDPGLPQSPCDKPGVDLPGGSSGEASADSNNVVIPSEYLNLPKHRKVTGVAPTITQSSASAPSLTSSTSDTAFSVDTILNSYYKLFGWGMHDWALVDRGKTSARPSVLKVAGQVHGGAPEIVNWLGAPTKARTIKSREWDNYNWLDVPGHEETISYSYTYQQHHSGSCDSGCYDSTGKKTCDGDHSYDSTETGTGSYPVSLGQYQYSSKNTVFNDQRNVTPAYQPTATFNKNTKQGYYYGPVNGTDAVYKFYPYYAMKYYGSSISAPQQLWMLATGERTLKVKDTIKVEVKMDRDADMIAPWSRDKYDSVNKPSTVLNVVKAGSAVQVMPPKATGKLTYTYYVQDKGFIGAKETIGIKPEAIRAFESMFQPSAVDMAVYSNVPLTGSLIQYSGGNTYDCSVNNDIVKSSTINSYRQKPRDGAIATTKNFDKNSIKVTVTRNNSIPNQQATCMSGVSSSVAIAGVNVPVRYSSANLTVMDIANISKSPGSLLAPGKDINGVALPWYKEEYEGILKVEIEGTFSLEENESKQTWFEIYPHLSDGLSDYNTEDNNYVHPNGQVSKPIYEGSDYIFGVGLVINPSNTPNGDIIFLPNPAHTMPFQIRGSVFNNTK